ncbi:hypothetical protein C4D60_Mb07t02310 [Musa balbisiana]|uniref:Uncharacterized protein n=1 Tax=Musa balbisiana TaxID=52838 RepID=A0A4S8JE85_MUSBA|nr:hypothetical protein C4D60_Mb07t02310 [Musa balbisiana]
MATATTRLRRDAAQLDFTATDVPETSHSCASSTTGKQSELRSSLLVLRGGFRHPGDDAFLARGHETNSNTGVNHGSIVHSSGRLDDELLFYLDCETELQPKINILRSSLVYKAAIAMCVLLDESASEEADGDRLESVIRSLEDEIGAAGMAPEVVHHCEDCEDCGLDDIPSDLDGHDCSKSSTSVVEDSLGWSEMGGSDSGAGAGADVLQVTLVVCCKNLFGTVRSLSSDSCGVVSAVSCAIPSPYAQQGRRWTPPSCQDSADGRLA